MASLLSHLHFWTFKTLYPGTASGSDIGHHVYHDKAAVPLEGVTHTARKEWAEGRGITWQPSNKKPEKLRDTLKECEELLSNHHPVAMKWKGTRHCLVVLDNGVLITYTVARHSGDIEHIFIDKSLVPRLGAKIDKAVIMGDSILVTTDGRKLCHVMSTRKRASSASYHNPLTLTNTDSGRRLEKLSVQDLKISYLSTEEVPSDQVTCHLMGNDKGDLMALWWKDEQEEGWGRSFMANSSRNNLLLFTFKEAKLQYCAGLQTDGVPITMEFSRTKVSTFYVLEKIGPSEYISITYECVSNKVMKVAVSSPIESRALIKVCARNRNEYLLLLGCEDSTLILYNSAIVGGKVKKTKAIVTPVSFINWHPTGTVAFVCSASGGNIQCYDLGLNRLFFQLLSEEPERPILLMIGSHFVAPVHLQLAEWGSNGNEEEKEGCYDNFMMIFDRGPLVLLRIELGVLSRGNLRPLELVSEYIQQNDIEKGLSIMEGLDWNYQQNDAFSCLTILINHLLIQPLTSQTESYIEAALASFSSPVISPLIMTRYKPHVVNLQRRFFFLLLRFRWLVKAYEVAQDIQARDLFMDVHFLAAQLNDHELAEKAKQAAEDLLSSEPTTAMPWIGFSRPDRAMSYSPSASPLSGDGSLACLHPSTALHSDEDIRQALEAISTLSFSFDSLTSSFSTSPLMEHTTSDHSATPHSELEDYSDNEATQEAEQNA